MAQDREEKDCLKDALLCKPMSQMNAEERKDAMLVRSGSAAFFGFFACGVPISACVSNPVAIAGVLIGSAAIPGCGTAAYQACKADHTPYDPYHPQQQEMADNINNNDPPASATPYVSL